MNIFKKLILLPMIGFVLHAGTCVAQSAANSPEGLRIHYLGANRTLIQVDEPKRYLLLPIEESAPEANINVLVNGKLEQNLRVRLALSRVEYYVPFDLTPYAGEGIAFDILTENSRANVRDAVADAYWSHISLSDSFDTANRDKYRPLFHHTPQYGWMNDPNGMFYLDGTWHLHYQYNPYGSMWGNMTWGHSTSTDLVHWTHHEPSIRPDGLGTIFSGSCVVDAANTAGFGHNAVIAIYTSAASTQIQSLAVSTDGGKTFTPYKHNPIIVSDKECRDPHMFWHAESGRWIMILAAALEKEMWIYSSPDLIHWTKESTFGKGYGAQDGVWECPDLFPLTVPDGSGRQKWVLVCNINPGGIYGGSATQYFVGDFDGKTFTCDSAPDVTKWMDWGKDHYAAVSWSNAPQGRRTVIAWMSNWQYANGVPTKQYRSANSLPRDLSLYDGGDGQLYLAVTPSPEVETLRAGKPATYSFNVRTKAVSKKLPVANDGICEIDLMLGTGSAEQVFITLSNDLGEQVTMTYDLAARTFGMDRTRSGLTDFSADFPAVTKAPAPSGSFQRLRLFIDRCSIEAFEGEGRFAMTNLVFPTKPYDTISVSTDGGRCRVRELNIYPIK